MSARGRWAGGCDFLSSDFVELVVIPACTKSILASTLLSRRRWEADGDPLDFS